VSYEEEDAFSLVEVCQHVGASACCSLTRQRAVRGIQGASTLHTCIRTYAHTYIHTYMHTYQSFDFSIYKLISKWAT
jgi:hypothetical protein